MQTKTVLKFMIGVPSVHESPNQVPHHFLSTTDRFSHSMAIMICFKVMTLLNPKIESHAPFP